MSSDLGSTSNSRSSSWRENVVVNSARRAALAAGSVAELSTTVAELGVEIARRMRAGGKLLFCGNGGSAAAAQHFSAEFTGKLSLDRRPWPAISLTTDTSALTAIANDYGFQEVFARQVRALATPDDVLIGLTTSGGSANVLAAFDVAREIGALTVALTGPSTAAVVDWHLPVGVTETARIQEMHELVLHALCAIIERELTPELGDDQATDAWPFVLPEQDLPGYRSWMKATSQTLATTNGVFDLLHAGHRASLEQAQIAGDRLIVLVNDDASVKRLKGSDRPVRSLSERIDDLRMLAAVSHVVVLPDDDPVRLLTLIKPDVHLKGAEYRDRPMPERDIVVGYGGRIGYINLVPGQSTTLQVETIKRGEDS